jgi:multidrug resistance efflux pump
VARAAVAVVAAVAAGLLGAVVLSAPAGRPDEESAELAELALAGGAWATAIKDIQVPAQEPGMLVAMHAEENQEVEAEQLLAQIDDRQALAIQETADWKVKAAEKEATNPVSVEYAKASRDVAEADLMAANAAHEKQPGSFPLWERRKLALKLIETRLHVQQAEHDLAVLEMKASVQRAELKAAELDVGRRKVKSPMKGVVEKKWREVGDWVKPGDAVYRIIQMDQLYVQELLDATRYTDADVKGKNVLVTFRRGGGEVVKLGGRIEHTSYRLVAGGRKFLVKAVVNNQKRNGFWLLHPGQLVQMDIQTNP